MEEKEMMRIHDLHNDEEANKGNLDVVGEIYTDDYVSHDPTRPDVTGHEG